MKILDLTFSSPADDLACDEALLDQSENAPAGGTLRFWEPKKYFVVLGYSNAWKEEVNAGSGAPVYRRCSGGGAVLQGPGCLNYSLILDIKPGGPFDNIRSTNLFIMQRHREALERLLKKEVRVQGHTDLTIVGATSQSPLLKFSGNAQRRKRDRLLFHGTFLLRFRLSEIERCLKVPAKQPAYRQNRDHASFVTNLDLPAEAVKKTLVAAWGAKKKFTDVPVDKIRLLARERYGSDEWNLKF